LGTIYQSIEMLSKEKGIDPQVIIEAVKDAILVAARKQFKTNEELVAEMDEKTGMIQIFGVKKIVAEVTDKLREISLNDALVQDPRAVVGGEVRTKLRTEALGRISAQTAKQVIMQKVREAERDTIFSEFHNRVGELSTCTIKRVEGQDLICDLGKTEARMPKKEQSRLESFNIGDRVRCVIKSVERSGKNSGVILSRADCEFVKRLFEQEVPEIYDNTVVIKACAREAGERTKIAVASRDRDVDSVGACVGMKGMRVQSIIRELRGEKIDIIEHSEDPVAFATHALSPAKISRVAILDLGSKHMEVIVDDSQLSLAIGKKGQNVPGRQTDRLEDRYQERRGEAPGGRAANGLADELRRPGFGVDRLRPAGSRCRAVAGWRRGHRRETRFDDPRADHCRARCRQREHGEDR